MYNRELVKKHLTYILSNQTNNQTYKRCIKLGIILSLCYYYCYLYFLNTFNLQVKKRNFDFSLVVY